MPPERPTLVGRQCPNGTCDGSGRIVNETTRTTSYCACWKQIQAAARARGLSATIPNRYRGMSFDRIPINQMEGAAVAAVRAYTDQLHDRLDTGAGLWMYGPVGTGKTSLAMLVNKYALTNGYTVAIYSLPRLLATIRTTFDDHADSTYTHLLERLVGVDLLHIDDVGAEKTSPWVIEQLYSIINARYEERRAVMITTNLDRGDLVEQISERAVSRLEEMCEVLPVMGVDHRRRDAA